MICTEHSTVSADKNIPLAVYDSFRRLSSNTFAPSSIDTLVSIPLDFDKTEENAKRGHRRNTIRDSSQEV